MQLREKRGAPPTMVDIRLRSNTERAWLTFAQAMYSINSCSTLSSFAYAIPRKTSTQTMLQGQCDLKHVKASFVHMKAAEGNAAIYVLNSKHIYDKRAYEVRARWGTLGDSPSGREFRADTSPVRKTPSSLSTTR
eukprot:4807491-Pleurochrysis_carterae.AAC.1